MTERIAAAAAAGRCPPRVYLRPPCSASVTRCDSDRFINCNVYEERVKSTFGISSVSLFLDRSSADDKSFGNSALCK